MSYSDTPHGPVCNSGTVAVLRDVDLPSWQRVQVLDREADDWLAKNPDPAATGRLCDVCSAPLDGRGDQKTCSARCRKQLSRETGKVVAELIAKGYEDVREQIEVDAEFAEQVRQAAIGRLTVSPMATAVANADAGSLVDEVDHDEWLWVSKSPQPEQIVTGDHPAWQRVSRYDNPHHLRWPSQVAAKQRKVTAGNCEPLKPSYMQGPFGPFRPADRKHC